MYGRVLHSTPPLHGGAITRIEPGITSTDGYFKPSFGSTLDDDYVLLSAYKRAMLKKYGSDKWQELQEKAETAQKRLTAIENRLQRGSSDAEKVVLSFALTSRSGGLGYVLVQLKSKTARRLAFLQSCSLAVLDFSHAKYARGGLALHM